MKHLNLTPEQFCDATAACEDGRKFALTQPTMADVWNNCSRPDWLIWILDAIDAPRDDKMLRLFAVWCARNTPMPDGRTTGASLTDPRSIAALEVAERYAHGMATAVELAAARAAAWDAARAAAWDAAESAARDAARAAARAAAWDAARAAAWDAARAAAWDAARAAAWAAAESAAQAAQADQLRKMIVNPFAQRRCQMSAPVTEAHIAKAQASGYTTDKGVQMAAQFVANNEAAKAERDQLRTELDAQCLLNAKGSEREAVLLRRVDRMAKECLNLRADLDAIKAIRNEETARAERAEAELAAEREKVRVLQEAMKFLANKDMYFQVKFDPCQRASAALAATEDKQ